MDVLQARHDVRVASGRRPGIDLPMEYAALPAHCCWTPLDLGDAPCLTVDTTGGDVLPGVPACPAGWNEESHRVGGFLGDQGGRCDRPLPLFARPCFCDS